MKKKIIAGIVVLVVVAGGAFFALNREATVAVDVVVVEEGRIVKYVEELGVIKTERNANVYAAAAGRVTEVLVDVGDGVKSGEVLIRMDTQPLSTQAKELQAQRDLITAQYKEAMKTVEDQERQKVETIQKLALQLRDGEARLQELQRSLDRNRQLYDAGAISQETYHASVVALEAEERNIERIKLDKELAQRPLSENISPQYEAQLRQIDLQLEAVNHRRGDLVVTAPMGGTLMMKAVEVGSYLQPGSHMMAISDIKDLYVEAEILIADIAHVQGGDDVILVNEDLGILDLRGKVRKIHPQAFTSVSDLGIEQKRIKVDIEMEEIPENLRPGYELDIKIILEEKENVLNIPENAIFQQEGKDFVFVKEDGIATLREITRGIESQRQVEIVGGLQRGEMVILSPDDTLEEGIGLRIND